MARSCGVMMTLRGAESSHICFRKTETDGGSHALGLAAAGGGTHHVGVQPFVRRAHLDHACDDDGAVEAHFSLLFLDAIIIYSFETVGLFLCV